jgi:hypothetical protein
MDAFTSAGLRRIAVACGATDEDVATGDPAGALVSRWLQMPVDEWFKDLREWQGMLDLTQEDDYAEAYWMAERGGWLGLEDTGPLPFIRFAGFVEAGTRFGYLDLRSFPARDELRLALERWNLGDDARGRSAGLAVSLRERLAGEAQRLSDLRNAAGVAAFESYIRLDETVRRDLDLREFLAVCHSGRPHAKTDAIFLAAPEFFAEALAARRVRRLPVGGQVSGGLQAARALERLSRLLGGLGHRECLRETLILHARWAHQVDKVFDRLEQWIIRAQEWNSDAASANDYSPEWLVYLAGTVVPLAHQQRSLGLLASPDWHPRQHEAALQEEGGDLTLFVEPEGTSPSDVEDAIRNLSKQADDAASKGYADAALSLHAEAARLRAEHLNYEVTAEVLGYWELIWKVLRLGDRDTAALLCAGAYPALRDALKETGMATETLEELMESLRRPRSAGRPGTASGASDAPPASSDTGTIQKPFGGEQASGKEAPPSAREAGA